MKKFFSSALMSLTILMSTSTASYADDGNTLRYFFQQPGAVWSFPSQHKLFTLFILFNRAAAFYLLSDRM
jgi:hypothetical protein